MAADLGVPVSRYVKMEAGEEPATAPAVGRLKPHEKCVIMRRRVGTTQAALAEALGCCRRWVQLMERGEVACDDLTWYWEQ